MIYHKYSSKLVDDIGHEYYDDRVINQKTNPKIYDVAHKYLPDLGHYDSFHHIITTLLTIPIIFNLNMFQEYLSYWITIFIIRSITNLVTILPKNKHCKKDKAFMFMGGCYDKIFSGHFVSVFLATLLYMKYGWINMDTLVIINFINSMSILLSRGHYTIDLIVAYFVTMYVYQNKLTVI